VLHSLNSSPSLALKSSLVQSSSGVSVDGCTGECC
jgi:hypothetical protein